MAAHKEATRYCSDPVERHRHSNKRSMRRTRERARLSRSIDRKNTTLQKSPPCPDPEPNLGLPSIHTLSETELHDSTNRSEGSAACGSVDWGDFADESLGATMYEQMFGDWRCRPAHVSTVDRHCPPAHVSTVDRHCPPALKNKF